MTRTFAPWLAFGLVIVLASIPALVPANQAAAGELTVQSGPARTHLLELYTSEGCSSCPPAERWFSTLRQSPRLWKEIVPVAFHVDYWDRLGWKDRFASAANTARQRSYAVAWRSDTVYTPGFVLDGREWQGRNVQDVTSEGGLAGTLTAVLRDDGEVLVRFRPVGNGKGPWQAHVALLGFGLKSDVNAGENSGRTLLHDFVVLTHAATTMIGGQDNEFRATFGLLRHPTAGSTPSAFAVWANEAGRLEPVQAAGGELPKNASR